MKAVIVIITGLPGTGKSTVGRAVSDKLDCRYFNTDIIREELNLRGRYDEDSKERIYREMMARTEQLLRQGEGVVIDGTFYKQKLRNRFQRLANRYRKNIHWVELNADEEVIRDRVKENRPHSEADFEVYKKIKAIYEPIAGAHLVLRSDELTVDEMTDRIMDFLMLRT